MSASALLGEARRHPDGRVYVSPDGRSGSAESGDPPNVGKGHHELGIGGRKSGELQPGHAVLQSPLALPAHDVLAQSWIKLDYLSTVVTPIATRDDRWIAAGSTAQSAAS